MDKPNKTLSAWNTLWERLSEFVGGDYIYRGVPDKNFNLRPSIGRDNARKEPQGKEVGVSRYCPADEDRILKTFKRQALPFQEYPIPSALDYMVLARHNGVPTRLLDWTESPLVAAFFATENMGGKKE